MTPAKPAAARLTTRAVSSADEPFLLELYATIRARDMARLPWPDERKRRFLSTQFAAQRRYEAETYPGGSFSIVECDGEPVGRLSVHAGPEEIRLIDIAIVPHRRGRGIGTTLLEAIVRQADRSGRRVTLNVERDSPARQWYARLGFTHLREHGVHYFMERRPAAATARSSGSW